jgi:hypothetical protein
MDDNKTEKGVCECALLVLNRMVGKLAVSTAEATLKTTAGGHAIRRFDVISTDTLPFTC